MRTWVYVIVGLALALLIGAGLTFNRGVSVEAARVGRGRIQEYIDEEAKTRLADSYLITMPSTGRIEQIELREGAAVRAGQVVARIVPLDLDLDVRAATAEVDRLKASIVENDDVSVESTTLEQSLSFVDSMTRTVEAATARVRSGEAKLQYAEKNLGRVRQLAKRNAQTEEALDQAELNNVQSSVDYQQDVLVQRAIESMHAATALMPTLVRQYIQRKGLSSDVLAKQLLEAKTRLEQAERDRQRGTMVSPVDGVVLERALTNERLVSAGATLLKIGRWEDLEVEADVLSQEVVRVKPGDAVEFFGPAIGTPTARGRVARIYPAGFTKVSSLGVEQQRVKVVMTFEPDELSRLRSERELGVEYRVHVRIFTAEKSNALMAPRSALFRGSGGGWQLFAIRGGRAALQPVTIGLANDEFVEIVDGLAADEEIVLAPETNLADGHAVRPVLRAPRRTG